MGVDRVHPLVDLLADVQTRARQVLRVRSPLACGPVGAPCRWLEARPEGDGEALVAELWDLAGWSAQGHRLLAATDPANPYGVALPWPVKGPQRAAGCRSSCRRQAVQP